MKICLKLEWKYSSQKILKWIKVMKNTTKDKSKVTICLAMEQICTNVYANNTLVIEYPHCRSVLI